MTILYCKCPLCGSGKLRIMEHLDIMDCGDCRKIRRLDPELAKTAMERFKTLPAKYDSDVLDALFNNDEKKLKQFEYDMNKDMAYTWKTSLVFACRQILQGHPMESQIHLMFIKEWLLSFGYSEDIDLILDVVIHHVLLSMKRNSGYPLATIMGMFCEIRNDPEDPDMNILLFRRLCDEMLDEDRPAIRAALLGELVDTASDIAYVGMDLRSKIEILGMCKNILPEGIEGINALTKTNSNSEHRLRVYNLLIDTFLEPLKNLLDEFDEDDERMFYDNASAIEMARMYTKVKNCIDSAHMCILNPDRFNDLSRILTLRGREFEDHIFAIAEEALETVVDDTDLSAYTVEGLESEILQFMEDGDYDNAYESAVILELKDYLNWIGQLGLAFINVQSGKDAGYARLCNAVDRVPDEEMDRLITLMAENFERAALCQADGNDSVIRRIATVINEMEIVQKGAGSRFTLELMDRLTNSTEDEDAYDIYLRVFLNSYCIDIHYAVTSDINFHRKVTAKGLDVLESLYGRFLSRGDGATEDEAREMTENCIQLTRHLLTTVDGAISSLSEKDLDELVGAWRRSYSNYVKLDGLIKVIISGKEDSKHMIKQKKKHEEFVKSYLKGPPGFNRKRKNVKSTS